MAYNLHTDNETKLDIDEYWSRREKKIWVVTLWGGKRFNQFLDKKIIKATTKAGAMRTAKNLFTKRGRISARLADPILDLDCRISKTRPAYF